VICARSLRVDYDDVTAVWDLDLDIAPGEIYGLIGPNGAGKTSTIKALAGVLEPTYGEIRLGGVDALEHPEDAHRCLGYMPDFAPLYDDLKVWEYLSVFATAYALPRPARADRIEECLDIAKLREKRDAFIRELSRGMRQRLALAKTLLHEPTVLLLDEPASGMDPIGRVELRNILCDLARKGAAVLISSHILTELSGFCTSIGIMEKGRLVASGRVEDILQKLGCRGVLHVRAASPHPALAQVLEASEVLSQVEMKDEQTATALMLGSDVDAARLLGQLVAAGVAVSSFHVESEDIEDIFLKIGAREVS